MFVYTLLCDVKRMLDGPTPLWSARPMAFIAMAVENGCLLLCDVKLIVKFMKFYCDACSAKMH